MKIIFSNLIRASIFLFIFFSSNVYSATIVPRVIEITVQKGSVVYIPYVVNPSDEKIYTVSTEINFPNKLVEINSFELNPDLAVFDVPEYNFVDNKSGKLVKTVGFKNGTHAPKLVGIALFKAINKGEGTIKISKLSAVLDKNSKNVLKFYGTENVKIRVVDKIKETEIKEQGLIIKLKGKESYEEAKKYESEIQESIEYLIGSKLPKLSNIETKETSGLTTLELIKELIGRMIWGVVAIVFLLLSLFFFYLWIKEKRRRSKYDSNND